MGGLIRQEERDDVTEHPGDDAGTTEPFDRYAPPSSTNAPWGAPALEAPHPWGVPSSAPPQPWSQSSWPAYSTPYGWGPAGFQAPRANNPWAIVALVTGILAFVPVAVVAGIVALVQIRRRGQAGTGMAIAGLVIAGVWTVIVMIAIVAAAFAGTGSSGSLGRVSDASTTRVGGCLRLPTGSETIATEVDCSQGHDAEVYFVGDLGSASWPGSGTVGGRADDACFHSFEHYVGTFYDSSVYDYGYFVPDETEWDAGEHRAICVVLQGSADTLHGSVRGSGQ